MDSVFCTTFVRSRQSMQLVRNTPVCVAAGGESPIWKKYLCVMEHTSTSNKRREGPRKRSTNPICLCSSLSIEYMTETWSYRLFRQ